MWYRVKACVSIWLSLLASQWRMVYGVWKVTGLRKPVVTIFGGSQVMQDDPYAKQANALAQKLIQEHISVITGGGPGIMEAASCGAVAAGGSYTTIMGIGVRGLAEPRSTCTKNYFAVPYFFERKWLLTRFSSGFIVFPGGFGTFDELAEVLTLIGTNKMTRVPIVLIGTEYWQSFNEWLQQETVSHHKLIKLQEQGLFIITDDLDRAVLLVCSECRLGPKEEVGKL